MTRAQRYLLALSCLLISMQVAQAQNTNTAGYPGYMQRGRLHGFVPKHEKMQRAGLVPRKQPTASKLAANPFDAPVAAPVAATVPPPIADPVIESGDDSLAPIPASILAPGPIVQTDYIAPITQQPAIPIASAFESPVGSIAQTSCQCDSCAQASSPCSSSFSCASPVPCSSHSPCYRPMFWFSGEYLLWWTRGARAPSLVTSSPAGTDQDIAGVLGEPTTSTVFGDSDFHTGKRYGGRFTFGMWLSRARSTGLELRYTAIETDVDDIQVFDNDFDILARPFFNTQLIEDDARLLNFDGLVSNNLLSIRSISDFDTLELTMLRCVGNQSGISNFLFGYRSMSLDDTIRIQESSTSLATPTDGATTGLLDQFGVDNTFHGAQIGVHYVTQYNQCWMFDFLGKASVGSTRSRVRVNGQTTTSVGIPPDVATVDGGLLALGSNIGSTADSEFSPVFEVSMNMRRNFQNGLHFKVGYTFLHWGNVARAVEQIDQSINPTQVPPNTLVGPGRPRLDYNRSSFWAQGLNLGIEYQF